MRGQEGVCGELGGEGGAKYLFRSRNLVAQCSATPATVAATPPCSATPFQTQISVRHLLGEGGGRCDTKILRGCSATPVLHLQNALKSRKSAATRVARQGVPAIVCNYGPQFPPRLFDCCKSGRWCTQPRSLSATHCPRSCPAVIAHTSPDPVQSLKFWESSKHLGQDRDCFQTVRVV